MKRVIAVLTGCIMIAGAFASCRSSKSSDSAADTGTKASCFGKWEWGNDQYLDIDSDGTVRMDAAISAASVVTFNSDGSGTLGRVPFGPGQFDYDGETYRLHVDTDDDMTLRRLEPNDGTEFYGVYRLTSGTVYDGIERGYNARAAQNGDDAEFGKEDIEIQLDIGEDGTDMIILYTIGEILPEDRISFTIASESFDGTYSVDGDVMTIHAGSGYDRELRRVK